jgi:hypothetical protein
VRRLGLLIAAGMLVAACSGATDTAGDGATNENAGAATDAPDPCALADDATLAAYFGEEAVEGEPGAAGPLATCSWRNANANSLLIQVAADHELYRPDPCDGCVDLTFADEGYVTESSFQSTATFVSGSTWYSVTTTGFGDDSESIADLAETIFQNDAN